MIEGGGDSSGVFVPPQREDPQGGLVSGRVTDASQIRVISLWEGVQGCREGGGGRGTD